MHYVIIGHSAAGINAAEIIRKLDQNGQITIVSAENTRPYSRCLLSHYLGGEISKERLFIREKTWDHRLKLTMLLGQKVISIHTRKGQITLANQQLLSYDRLLIATGSSPLFIPIKGTSSSGVFCLRNLQDADNIIQFIQTHSIKSVVVLGAGFIGLKTAYGFWQRGFKVTVIEKLTRLMPRMLDQGASSIYEKIFKSHGINLILGESVTEIITHKDRVVGSKLENGKIIPCQLVIISVGVKPNIDFVRSSEIKTYQGIIVDQYLQTNIENIFAAGDVAETIDLATGNRTINALWSTAATQGKIAGYNMSGYPRRYEGSLAMNAVEFFGLPLISFGIVNPPSDGYKTIIQTNPSNRIYHKIIWKEDHLVGLILVGEIEKAGVYLSLLKRKENCTYLLKKLKK